MRVNAEFPEMFEVGKDTFHSSYFRCFSFYVKGVGPQIDLNIETIFHQAKVLVTCAVQRLDSGRKLECFFYQG